MWAVIRAGGRVNGASPAYTAEEMTHALKTANSKILMTLPNALPVALAAADTAGIPHGQVLLLEGTSQGFTNIQDLIEQGRSYTAPEPYRIPANTDNRKVCGYLNFSSGTTGLPKAVSQVKPVQTRPTSEPPSSHPNTTQSSAHHQRLIKPDSTRAQPRHRHP